MTAPPRSHLAAAPRPLSFAAPIDRAVIHKTGLGEVFLTDSVRVAADQILIAGELPRAHAFFNDHADARRLPLMAPLELARQTGYVLGHRHFGAPIDACYVLRTLHGTLSSRADGLALHRPTPVILRTHLAEQFGRGGVTTGARAEIEMVACDGPPIGRFGLSFSWMPRERWQRLRAGMRSLPAPLPPPRRALPSALVTPQAVGLQRPAGVLLAGPAIVPGDASQAALLVDPHYAPIFDHPGDHVSGVALIEGWRQHAVWSAAQQLGVDPAQLGPRSVRAEFHSVAEFDAPLSCSAQLDAGSPTVQVEGRQGGRSVGAATFGLAARPAGSRPR